MNGRTVKAIIILLSVLAVSFAGIGVLKNRNTPPPEISGGTVFPDGGNGTGCQSIHDPTQVSDTPPPEISSETVFPDGGNDTECQPIHDPTQVFVYDVTDGVM